MIPHPKTFNFIRLNRIIVIYCQIEFLEARFEVPKPKPSFALPHRIEGKEGKERAGAWRQSDEAFNSQSL
jgi:hypothetical protein